MGASSSQIGLLWKKFRRHRLAQLGMVIISIILIITIFAPFFAPYDPLHQNYSAIYAPPQKIHFWDESGRFSLRPFVYALERKMDPTTFKTVYVENTSKKCYIRFFVRGWRYKLFGLLESNLHLFGVESGGTIHIFGTDSNGRDLFSRILFGGRYTMLISCLAGLTSGLIAAVVGCVSGYFGGMIDMAVQRVIEVMMCFPSVPLWMTFSAAIPRDWKPIYVVFALTAVFAVLNWPGMARAIRGKVLPYRDQEFVMAARAIGVSQFRIVFRHVLPQALSHIIVSITLLIPGLILGESTLSFLGLGVRSAEFATWGALLQRAQNLQTLALYPWIMIPGLFIVITVLAINFIGDGLRDAADPYSKR